MLYCTLVDPKHIKSTLNPREWMDTITMNEWMKIMSIEVLDAHSIHPHVNLWSPTAYLNFSFDLANMSFNTFNCMIERIRVKHICTNMRFDQAINEVHGVMIFLLCTLLFCMDIISFHIDVGIRA